MAGLYSDLPRSSALCPDHTEPYPGNYVYHISITWVHLVLPVIILVLIFAAVIALLTGEGHAE